MSYVLRIEGESNTYATYEDTGCNVSRSCLQCPLPECKYENAHAYRQFLTRKRDQAVLDGRLRGETAAVLAQRARISSRTVWHILQRGVEEGHIEKAGIQRRMTNLPAAIQEVET